VLHNEAEAENPDFEKLTAQDFRKYVLERQSYDPEGHFVAATGDKIIGSGRGIFSPKNVEVTGPEGYFRLHILPSYLGTDVEKKLFARILDYLINRGAELIVTRADTRFTARVQLLERLGFSKNEYENHGMEQDTRKMDDPEIPEEYRIRVARVPEEIELMHGIFNKAFATRKKYPLMSLKRFRNSRIFEDKEDHSGIFLAERMLDKEVVGMVISEIDRKYNEAHGAKRGGTYSLAIIPSERRKGLGTALTLKSLKWLWEKGMEKAYIGVNMENRDAVSLYKSTGYRTVQVYQGFQLDIS